jgi:four helix bundle protein
MNTGMRNPAKIRVLGAAEEFAVAAYGATSRFPTSERFGLTTQIRRAAISIGSNIAEGSHRQGNNAFLPFLHNAAGSAAEVSFQIRIASRLGFGDPAELERLRDTAEHVKAMIIRMILALRSAGD